MTFLHSRTGRILLAPYWWIRLVHAYYRSHAASGLGLRYVIPFANEATRRIVMAKRWEDLIT